MKSEATLSTYVVTDGCVRAIGPRTLENLSPEILIIIFEQVRRRIISLFLQDAHFIE